MRTLGEEWGDPENDPRNDIIAAPTIGRVDELVAGYTPERYGQRGDVEYVAELRRKQLRGEPSALDEEDGNTLVPPGPVLG